MRALWPGNWDECLEDHVQSTKEPASSVQGEAAAGAGMAHGKTGGSRHVDISATRPDWLGHSPLDSEIVLEIPCMIRSFPVFMESPV